MTPSKALRCAIGLSSLLALAPAACSPVEPVYDADIGLAGIPVEPGALDGLFALATTTADLADVPLLGEQQGGGTTFAWVDRRWDGTSYAQTNHVCRVDNVEVAGLTTVVTAATARAITPSAVTPSVAHETGAFSTGRFMELWGLKDIALDDPVPTSADDPRVWDMDDDGNPGATMLASGVLEGEIYVAQRKTLSLRGVVRGPDELVGLVTHLKEGTIVGATNPLLANGTERAQHPDPKESWWHEVRLGSRGDDVDCDDVEAAIEDGTLPLLRPF